MDTNYMEEKKQVIQLDRVREKWIQDIVMSMDSIAWQLSDSIGVMKEKDHNEKRLARIKAMKNKKISQASSMMSQIHDAFAQKLIVGGK